MSRLFVKENMFYQIMNVWGCVYYSDAGYNFIRYGKKCAPFPLFLCVRDVLFMWPLCLALNNGPSERDHSVCTIDAVFLCIIPLYPTRVLLLFTGTTKGPCVLELATQVSIGFASS